ncbi:MAG: hypothetical protein AAEJ53_14070 [Myxococcota bacterium]
MNDELGLPEALERAASALESDSEAIRPANGDPLQLLDALDEAGAGRVLTWLLCNEPAAGGELALVWAEEGSEGLAPLLGLDPAALPKAARKTLRRLIHNLRSSGVELPAAEPRTVVARLAPVEDGIDEALVTLPDPSGARLLFLASAHPGGGVRLFQAEVDEDLGLRGFEVFEIGRRDARRFLRELSRGKGLPAVSAPPESLRALIARAVAGQSSEHPLPRGFAEWRSQLTETQEDTPTPGEIAERELSCPDEDREELRSRALKQVEAGQLGPWISRLDLLEDTARQLEDAAGGVVVVSGGARRARMAGLLDEALDRLYGDEAGEPAARRFEEAAFVLWKSGEEEDARACLCAARDFREKAPRENEIARAGIQRVLGPFIEKLMGAEGEKAAESDASLLVKP